jgi:hypothetical protein
VIGDEIIAGLEINGDAKAEDYPGAEDMGIRSLRVGRLVSQIGVNGVLAALRDAAESAIDVASDGAFITAEQVAELREFTKLMLAASLLVGVSS